MSQSCTIYLEKGYSDILAYLESLEMREVSDSEVKTFERNYFEGSLRVSLKKQAYAGDGFSSMILGTWNFFRDVETKHENQQKDLLNRILSCQSAVGVAANPEFTETDKRLDFVFELARLFDGVIFNGSEMIDQKGRLILDQAGNSELN